MDCLDQGKFLVPFFSKTTERKPFLLREKQKIPFLTVEERP
jgi:hypothetical protein